ncbi:aldo/keto reductase [Ligilactobacillus pobuzihii]|uniref:aldo/keto reductase n=1 Tax=Ligilactobacillus pobuzihii TaxID=449659 RepID=UPI0019CFE1DA|nr:aldo/keto reductase [Ligilactobacillus pobuzihii]MBN7275375.1 aldo/keto reductase [Ligilactobacillus pobuzihii]
MTILNEKYTLNDGIQIPKLGFGTWLIDNAKVATAVEQAAKLGYRHFDTAQAYGNEEGVGAGIKAMALKRDELFITTKVQAEIKDYKAAKKSIDESLQKLGIDYLDLLLIHAPEPWAEFHGENHYFKGNLEVWKAMEEAVQAGKVRSIGVSNFKQADLTNILENCSIKPTVNQLLTHIGNTSFELLKQAQANEILVEAYSPVAHGEMLQNKQIKQMADKYQVSIPQLAIRYCLELGTLPLPKSENPEHIANNADVDFKISATDLQVLKKFPQFKNYGNSSDFPVFSGK